MGNIYSRCKVYSTFSFCECKITNEREERPKGLKSLCSGQQYRTGSNILFADVLQKTSNEIYV